jgi:hypothetical protein
MEGRVLKIFRSVPKKVSSVMITDLDGAIELFREVTESEDLDHTAHTHQFPHNTGSAIPKKNVVQGPSSSIFKIVFIITTILIGLGCGMYTVALVYVICTFHASSLYEILLIFHDVPWIMTHNLHRSTSVMGDMETMVRSNDRQFAAHILRIMGRQFILPGNGIMLTGDICSSFL